MSLCLASHHTLSPSEYYQKVIGILQGARIERSSCLRAAWFLGAGDPPKYMTILNTTLASFYSRIHCAILAPMSPALASLGLIGFQLTTTSTVVGFASPSSWLRLLALPFMVLLVYFQLSHLNEIQYPVGRAFLGATSIFLVIL